MSAGQQDFLTAGPPPGVAPKGPPGAESVQERWIEIEGARMRYLSAGSGPPLILLHGLLGYSFSWRFVIPALAPYVTMYAPDMLGAGFSDRAPHLDHSMRAQARRLLQFADRMGLKSFDLLGTSHGGAVAMLAADESLSQRSGPQVRRLVLVAPVNPYSTHGRRLAPFFGRPFGSALFRLTIARMTLLYRLLLIRLYGGFKPIPPGTLEGYMAPLAVPGLFDHGLRICTTWTEDLKDLAAALPRLSSISALLLWGSDDPAVYASSAAALAHHFAESQRVIFPGVGHLPYEECPEKFNPVLIEFLAGRQVRS